MKKLILLSAIILVGCATTQPQQVTVVKVPVPVMSKRADMPERPALMVRTLPKTLPTQEQYSAIVRAVEIDYASLINYSKSLERIVDTYNTGLNEAYLETLKSEITDHQK